MVVAASGCFGAAAGCTPVGGAAADHVLTGVLAAGVALAATTASGSSLMVGSAVVIAAGDSLTLHIIGMVALGASVLLEWNGRSRPTERAIVGALIVQALLRLPWTAPARGSALVAFVGLAPILVSGVLGRRRAVRHIVIRSILVAGGLVALATLASGYAVVRSHTLLQAGEDNARAAVDAARAGNRRLAATEFARAQGRFDDANDLLGSWTTFPARQLPIVGQQLRVLERVASIGARTIPVARDEITRVDPDRLRLVDGRLDLATIASYQPDFDRLADETRAARQTIARLPRVWLLPQVERPLTRFVATVVRADESARTADEAVRLAPAILGAEGPRTYLLAIVSPAESRGGGGFMSNYGVLTAKNGRLDLTKVGPLSDLENAGMQAKHYTASPEYLARYAKYDPTATWRIATMSPDLPSVAKVMAQLYLQSGGSPIDGVIRIDPTAMSGLLRLTGPVRVPRLATTLDANNVVDYLLRDQYNQFSQQSLRKDVLGDVARAVFDRLTTGRSAQPSQFGDALSPAVRTGNLALWFRDARAQALVRRIHADAALPAKIGDSFGVMVQNAGGNKIDEYLHRSMDYRTVVSASGDVRARAVVTLKNAAPATGLPLYVIGNDVGLPIGTNQLYVSVYSSLKLRNATLDGRAFSLLAERELGRNVYSGFVEIPPGGTRTLSVSLGGTVDLSRGGYQFDYLAEPLPNPDTVNFAIRTPDASVSAGVASGAAPIAVNVAAHSATAHVPLRGPWSVGVRLAG